MQSTEVILLEEAGSDIGTKGHGGTSFAGGSSWGGGGICPQEVAESSLDWRFEEAVDCFEVLESDCIFGGESAVANHDFTVEYVGEWEGAEHL